jgi:hypothetical protein
VKRSLIARSLAVVPVCLLALAATSCGTKTDASLSVYAQNLSLTKTSNPFGAKLTGSVEVVLDLGHWAQKPVAVQTVSLRLVRNDAPILADATFTPQETLPVTVQPSSKHAITYLIELQNVDATVLCAGPVGVSGAVTNDAEAGQVSIGTTPIVPAGCP